MKRVLVIGTSGASTGAREEDFARFLGVFGARPVMRGVRLTYREGGWKKFKACRV